MLHRGAAALGNQKGARDVEQDPVGKLRAVQSIQPYSRQAVLLLALTVLALTASVALGYHVALHRVQSTLASQLAAMKDMSRGSSSGIGLQDHGSRAAIIPLRMGMASLGDAAHVRSSDAQSSSHQSRSGSSTSSSINSANAGSKTANGSSIATTSSGRSGSTDAAVSRAQLAPVLFHPNVDLLLRDQVPLDYICYEPTAGLSSPVVTIITIINLKPDYMAFVHTNRMAYAMKHRYRYCEQRRPDPARIAAFGRIPLTLAMAPCTDYLLHVDGDSLFFNQEATLAPLLAQMRSADVDLLVARDIIPQSPFNFGVFLLRPADWLWQMFKQVYNHCACDWSRMHDWPAEQGLLYDVLVANQDKGWAKRMQVVNALNWNHLYPQWPNATGKELIVHLTNMPKPEPCEPGMHCKFKGIIQYWDQAVRSRKVPNITMPSRATYRATPNACQRINFKPLVQKDVTYYEHRDRYESSFLDYQPKGNGQYDLMLGELACLGWRDKKCSLKKYWNEERGTGPLQQQMMVDVTLSFFHADGSPKT